MVSNRVWAAELYVNALRTGEASATERAARFLAKDVELIVGQNEFKGHDEVVKRITGQWPSTIVYLNGSWLDPVEDGNQVKVTGVFGSHGSSPAGALLIFTFDASDKITRIVQENAAVPMAGPEGDTFPDVIRGIVNGAFINGTPMVMACVSQDGKPLMSLRGSIQIYSNHELSIWLRNAEGGSVAAVRKNPQMSLLYRDSHSRTTLMFEGLGRVADSEAERTRVYELTPEVEQNHDIHRKGAAIIVDIAKLSGFTTRGRVRMSRKI